MKTAQYWIFPIGTVLLCVLVVVVMAIGLGDVQGSNGRGPATEDVMTRYAYSDSDPIAQLEERIRRLEARLEGSEQRINRHDQRLGDAHERIDELANRSAIRGESPS